MNDFYANQYRTLAAFIRKHDRWMEICDEARDGDFTNYQPRSKMPTKNAKHRAYAAAYQLSSYLKLEDVHTFEGLRSVANTYLERTS